MKQFTSVLFSLVLVLGFSISSYADTIQESTKDRLKAQREQDEADCAFKAKGSKTSPAYQSCMEKKVGVYDDSAKGDCSTALEKLDKVKKLNPCPTAATSTACYEKIESCKASTGIPGLSGLNGLTGNEDIDGLTNSALEMIKATQAAKQNSATDVNADRSCYAAIQVRDKDAAEKRKTRTDQIIKDIEAADKERREANEKLAKETNETKVEQQKLQAETTKTLQKLDVEKREKLTKMNEELQKAGTDIRKQTTEIIKIKQAMEKMAFEQQKRMVTYTDEKINTRCKQSLATAKVCLVQSTKSKPVTDESCKDIYKAVGIVSGKGTKGTTDLKNKLAQIKEACFEQESQTTSTLKYDYADKVRTYEMDIKEKQEQIADSNKSLELKKTENEAITKETDTQKSQEQKSLEEQMANFAEKLANLETSTKEAVKSSEEKITRLNLELKDLKAGALASEVADPGSQSIYDNIADDALLAVGEISNATAVAYGVCCNTEKVGSKETGVAKAGASANCGSLYQQTKEEKKRTTVKAKDKTKT